MQDCEYEPLAYTVEAALAAVLSNIKPISETETVKIEAAQYRVLAEDLTAQTDLPPFTNAAMDGYAVQWSRCDFSQPFEVIGSAFAGRPYQADAVGDNQCIRITTGAVLPKHCDTVIMQEHCLLSDSGLVTIQTAPQVGQHVRAQGEDIAQGSHILSAGKRLTAADMAFIYACGHAEVRVYRQVNLAFFTTGDELQTVGQPLQPGQIYDSNRLALLGLLQQAHCQVTQCGIVEDNAESISATLTKSMQTADCILTTGGVSVGAVDHVKAIIQQLGKINFWRIAMKPGRPLTFGQLGNSAFFGLPGNPISVMATFYLFVMPALRKLSGETQYAPQRLTAMTDVKLYKKVGRSDYQRGYFYNDPDDQTILRVSTTGKQQSHILSGMTEANCFIELARDAADLPAGSTVTILPFSGFM